MKTHTLKHTNPRPAVPTTVSCRLNRAKCLFARFGLLAVLWGLSSSSALASFTNVQWFFWPGTDHFCGNTLISTSTSFNNAGSLIYTNSTLPTNTGPLFYTGQWSSGDYWWGIGVLDDGSDGAVINNTGTIQADISGYGSAQAVGIGSLQVFTITNWGAIDAQVLNNDGEAIGVWADSGGTTLVNNGTISARSQFSVVGVGANNNVYLVNNGTIQSIADAGTQGISANQSFADGIGTGSGLNIPEYFENNGQLINICASTTATNQARAEVQWANGPTVFKNSGFIYNASFSPNGAGAQGFYYGAQSKDMTFINSGTVTNYCPGNGYALWIENDGDRGDIYLNNSGTITSIGTDLIFLTGHWGPPSVGRTYYTNTGTYLGGQMRFYGTPATIYEAGQVHATLFGLNGNSDVHIMGLPTIDPQLECNNSTLEFNLVGTLQKVNGSAASGTNLTALNLGQSGNITVSDKTYSWSGATSVSGFVNSAGAVPSPWKQQDIGSVGVSGGAVYCGGMFTILASGSNIGGASDAFHYVYQTAGANCSIIAPISIPQTATTNAQAGVMIRDSLNANAANAFIGMTATNTVTFQYRSSDGGATSSNSVVVVNTAHWAELAQNGSALTGYYSVDGTNWTQLGSATVSMGTANYMGLAFCNHNNSSNGMATFYGVTCTGVMLTPAVPAGLTATAGVEQATLNWQAGSNTASYNIGRATVNGGPYTNVASVTTTNYTDRNLAGRTTYYYVVTAATPGSQSTNSAQVSATPTANVLSPWVAQDLGPVGTVGNESYTNGVFTVSGAGADIDNAESYDVGTQDTCRFVCQTNSGNRTIVARVTSVQNIDPESKAGVMIRSGLNADAANVFVGMTPSSGVYFSCRSANSAIGTLVNNVTNLTTPCWVSLAQSGTNFSGYYSADGNSWTLLGMTTVSMMGTDYLGTAVSSRDNWTLCTATFDNVTTPGSPPFTTTCFTWSAAVPITTADATLAPPSGQALAGAATFGGTACTVTLTNGTKIQFTSDGSVATATGGGTATGAFSGNSGNANFNAVLNEFNWDGGPKTITLTNLTPGALYTVKFVGLDDRSGENLRQAYLLDANVTSDVSQTWQMGSNVCVTGTFIASGSTKTFIEQLPGNSSGGDVNSGNANALVLWMALPAPAGLSATPVSSSQINLAWNAVTNAVSYNVKRSLTKGGPYTVVASGVTVTNYNDSGLAGGTVYYYVVCAMNNVGGEGVSSAQVNATTQSGSYGSLIHRYSFSETNGVTIADSIGGPVWSGTLPNGGTFSNGVLMLSSSSNQYANLPAGIVSSLSNCTLLAWVNLNSTTTWSRIFDFGNDTTTYMFLTPQNGASGTLRFALTTNSSGGEQQINCAATLTTGVWHQVGVTLNTNRGILYLDGVAVGTNTSMTLNPAILGATTNNYLGRSQWPADPYFNGLFDEFRIYNAGLSAAEIAATAALGSGGLLSTGSPPVSLARTGTNLAFSWPLASAGFTLQSRTNLVLSNWLNVTSPVPQITNGQWQVLLPSPSDARSIFYRLLK